MKPKRAVSQALVRTGPQPKALLADVRELILAARQAVAGVVDSGLTPARGGPGQLKEEPSP